MLLCIDFQPAYEEAFMHLLGPLGQRLERARTDGEEVHFIYNDVLSLEGEELGDPRDRVMAWMGERGFFTENTRLIRKNFGWVSHLFREGRERTVAVSILRSLMARGWADSSMIPRGDLERIVASSHDDFQGFWDCSPEAWEEMLIGAVAMPYLFEGGMIPWLKSLEGSVPEVIGGFRHRCLDEMCMMLEAAWIPYRAEASLIYGVPEEPAPSPAGGWSACESVSPLLFPAEELAVG